LSIKKTSGKAEKINGKLLLKMLSNRIKSWRAGELESWRAGAFLIIK